MCIMQYLHQRSIPPPLSSGRSPGNGWQLVPVGPYAKGHNIAIEKCFADCVQEKIKKHSYCVVSYFMTSHCNFFYCLSCALFAATSEGVLSLLSVCGITFWHSCPIVLPVKYSLQKIVYIVTRRTDLMR